MTPSPAVNKGDGDPKAKQVAAQCRAVAHLATAIAQVHSDKASIYERQTSESLLDLVGNQTAAFMEQLGDMLNAMDAVTKEDDFLKPVFKEAQRLWPQVRQ